MTSIELIDKFGPFIISPLGIQLGDYDRLSEADFEALLYHLATKQDELRWQVAAACNLYERAFRNHAYERAASIFELSPETIETWAYIERNVPYEIRRSERSIWFHKLVAKLEPDLQAEYLDYCIEHDLSHSRFEAWLIKQKDADLPPITYRSDRLFELEQENYNLINENLDLKEQLNDNEVETSQLSENKDYNGLVDKIIRLIQKLEQVYPDGVDLIKEYLG